MIGNSFNIFVIVFLLKNLLGNLGVVTPSFSVLCSYINGTSASLMMTNAPRPVQHTGSNPGTLEDSLRLVLKVCRGASYKGSDVSMAGPTATSELWPRKPLPSGWWKWKTALAYRFNHLHGAEHINALELRAVLSMIKCRATNLNLMDQRCLHLMDSQVCLGVMAKGRSSSFRLSRILQQISALQLAARLLTLGAYVTTDDNPADDPSRGRGVKRKRGR